MNTTFKPPFWHFNGHLQSILPSVLRKVSGVDYRRQRINTPDGDFLDIDWAQPAKQADSIVIVTHGLEGDSHRPYVKGIVKTMKQHGWDALAWNCRSCSGQINALPRFYHHGDASDLRLLVDLCVQLGYTSIALVGFSMGGSLSIRAIGEFPDQLPAEVVACGAVSVPIDLRSSVKELSKPGKRFYMKRFLRKLKKKIEEKERVWPEIISSKPYDYIVDFEDFDNAYTAPLHGYANAQDFYSKASVKPLLGGIKIPTLILQALNDPFLTPECLQPGTENPLIDFRVVKKGGHVGFVQKNHSATFAEQTIEAFLIKNPNRLAGVSLKSV